MNQKKICVGRIRRPHGIRGEVVIETYTVSPSFFQQKGLIFYTKENVTMILENPRIKDKLIITKIQGYPDRDSVESICNIDLFVDRDILPPLEAGEFYYEDLIGLTAFNEQGAQIGVVSNVCNYGAGTFIEIKLLQASKIANAPFKKDVVLSVDLYNSEIHLDTKLVYFSDS